MRQRQKPATAQRALALGLLTLLGWAVSGCDDGGGLVDSGLVDSGLVDSGPGDSSTLSACETDNGGCDELTSCADDAGAVTCGACPDGYSGTGAAGCVDVDECTANTDDCEQGCANTAGGFTCSCDPGFVLDADNASCGDVDECMANTDNCEQRCENTAGSFVCACDPGFAFAANGVTCMPVSCLGLLALTPSAPDGMYTVDPDADGALGSVSVRCDMTNGGWTMVMASGGVGPSDQAESTTVGTGTATYLPVAFARALAANGTQVHIRTEGLAATESITSVVNGIAIVRLREGLLLHYDAPEVNADPPTEWTGPFATDSSRLWYACSYPPFGSTLGTYPNIYHTCNNVDGLHLVNTASAWTQGAGTSLEVYVR